MQLWVRVAQTAGHASVDMPSSLSTCCCKPCLLCHMLLPSTDERNRAAVLGRSHHADRRNNDYVAVFHLAGHLSRTHSHALLMWIAM